MSIPVDKCEQWVQSCYNTILEEYRILEEVASNTVLKEYKILEELAADTMLEEYKF